MEKKSSALLIKNINDYMTKDSNNQLRKVDLTMAQVEVLSYLIFSEGYSRSLKEIEHHLSVAQSTAAGIVKRLETKKFVSSYISQDDKRRKMIVLTDKGIEYSSVARANMDSAEEMLLHNLTDEEKEIFYQLLVKINQGLNLSV